ncbi:MAG: hypothetical protein R3F56_12545 [Planctomycetota bacterium]
MTEMQDKPFALIGVNSDSLAIARKAVATKELNWRSFQNELASGGTISAQWQVDGWPTLVVLDRDMRINYRGHSGDEALAMVRRLVAEAVADGK